MRAIPKMGFWQSGQRSGSKSQHAQRQALGARMGMRSGAVCHTRAISVTVAFCIHRSSFILPGTAGVFRLATVGVWVKLDA